MAEITKEQYEREKKLIKKFVTARDIELREKTLEKVKSLEKDIKKEPLPTGKSMFGLHKCLSGLEERLWKMLLPRRIKAAADKKARRVSKKKK